MTAAARLRRSYFDCRYGQLHVYQAIPPGGGFDEATPLLCLPGARGSGRFFQALLGPLGADRSIYAPDLPGCGESDSAGAGAGAEQYALACIDLLDSLYQRRIGVLAHAEGGATAVALARLRPGTLVQGVVFSAAFPPCLAQAGELGLRFRELALAEAGAAAASAESVGAQLNELIQFFGTGKGNSN